MSFRKKPKPSETKRQRRFFFSLGTSARPALLQSPDRQTSTNTEHQWALSVGRYTLASCGTQAFSDIPCMRDGV